MDLKLIQKKLSDLRDKIRAEGRISDANQAELKSLLEQSLMSAKEELLEAQSNLSTLMAVTSSNQNTPLTDEQIFRLKIIEKTGTGSSAIH
jgi:phage I-like protein